MNTALQLVKRCSVVAAAVAVIAAAGSVGAQEPGPVSQAKAVDTAALRAYWTPERMAAAKPLPIPALKGTGVTDPMARVIPGIPGFVRGASPEEAQAGSPLIGKVTEFPQLAMAPAVFSPATFGSEPSDDLNGPWGPFQRWTQQGRFLAYPISTVGKLFFTVPGHGDYVCSGTVIGQNMFMTAGHCVAAGGQFGDGNYWFNSWLFCPSWNESGENPSTGCWGAYTEWTSGPWYNTGNPNVDYACIVTNSTGDKFATSIGNVTGWVGYGWNWGDEQAEVSMGYPAASPFDGNLIEVNSGVDWYDDSFGASTTYGASKFMGNDLTGGVSGGPWVLGYQGAGPEIEHSYVNNTNPGGFWVNGVNSHRRCNDTCAYPPISSSNGEFWGEISSSQFTKGVGGNGSYEIIQDCVGSGG